LVACERSRSASCLHERILGLRPDGGGEPEPLSIEWKTRVEQWVCMHGCVVRYMPHGRTDTARDDAARCLGRGNSDVLPLMSLVGFDSERPARAAGLSFPTSLYMMEARNGWV
jgi:hypothetical protein